MNDMNDQTAHLDAAREAHRVAAREALDEARAALDAAFGDRDAAREARDEARAALDAAYRAYVEALDARDAVLDAHAASAALDARAALERGTA